jgi:hypothetical protein
MKKIKIKAKNFRSGWRASTYHKFKKKMASSNGWKRPPTIYRTKRRCSKNKSGSSRKWRSYSRLINKKIEIGSKEARSPPNINFKYSINIIYL